MNLHVPPQLKAALWPHQVEAVRAMARYLSDFDTRHPRAGLVHMPTGSGKTAVIASLARCLTDRGIVVVVAPRIGLRDQLARDIRERFFRHAGVDPSSLPRHVIKVTNGTVQVAHPQDAIVVATVQMLSSIRQHARDLTEALQEAALVIFDEGHYEPAPVWSRAVRDFRCPRVILTATPFRDDFKLFDVDPRHTYRYSFHQARRDRYVRNVVLHSRRPVHSTVRFAAEVVDAYREFFGRPEESVADRPRVIIRCDKPEEIRQIVAALKRLDRSAIGIHETFHENLAAAEYGRVPNPDRVDATFWVHQFKLLEGIDDPRFRLLALYSELRSMRAFVQQVGRVIRNPRRAGGATAHVLDHSPRGRQTRLWNEFLEYDKLIDEGDPATLDLNQAALVSTLQEAVPGLLYVNGRLRRPADIAQLDLDALQLPLRVNVFEKPAGFSLARAQKLMVRQCEQRDLFYHAPAPHVHTAAVVYVSVAPSPLLEVGYFAEPTLGVSLVHAHGRYLFVFDSHGNLAASALATLRIAPVSRAHLRRLFPMGPDTRLTHVSTINANLGADQVRARSLAAVSVDQLVPSFDEHGYVLATATGYSVGRRGSDENEEEAVRRYVGTGNARVSDLSAPFVLFESWAHWTAELSELLDGRRQTLAVFNRWASDARVPGNPAPHSVLLDVAEVLHRYQTSGDFGLPRNQPMHISELCADVVDGVFSIEANGRRCRVEITFDASSERYELRSSELDRLYLSTDQDNTEGVVRFLNRSQSLRVIPGTPGYFYTLGNFFRPLIKFGPDYDDAKMGILRSLEAVPDLQQPMLEKGAHSRGGGSGWERGCLFDRIDTLGRGTRLAPYFAGTELLVCDDLNDESADFILVQRATATARRRVALIHAKASMHGSMCSAGALQDVCGQAQKNLREVSLFADPGPSKSAKWAGSWNGSPHTQGMVRQRIRRTSRAGDIEEHIRRVIKDPTSDREVWLIVGNLLRKDHLQRLLSQETPPGYAIHTAYLIFSTITNVAAAGARLRVFCG